MTKYYCVMQEDNYDCGIAALATILFYFNHNYTLEELKHLISYNPNTLTNFFQLHSLANQLGFNAIGYTLDSLDLFVKIELPCIAQISLLNDTLHFVVIFKINNNKVLISDPFYGLKTILTDNFSKYFTGNILVITPKNIDLRRKNE